LQADQIKHINEGVSHRLFLHGYKIHKSKIKAKESVHEEVGV